MTDRRAEMSERDRLVSRPKEPLPTAKDPTERGFPADPKPRPKVGQGTDPRAGDLDYVA